MKLRTSDDAKNLREQTINEYRAGRIDRHHARLQLQACRDLFDHVQMGDLPEDLASIREQLKVIGFGTREFERLIDYLADQREFGKGIRR